MEFSSKVYSKQAQGLALSQFKDRGIDPDDEYEQELEFLNNLDTLTEELKRATEEKQRQNELDRLRSILKQYEEREERVRQTMLKWCDMTKQSFIPVVVREAILSLLNDYIEALKGKK